MSMSFQQSTQLALNDSNIQNTRNSINKSNNSVRPSVSRLDEPWWIEHRFCLYASAIIISIIIAMTVGIVIVCVTSPKDTDPICQLNFDRSAERFTEYDSRPNDVSIGDFNEDDYLDIVVANAGTDSIGIIINNQNGIFAPQRIFSTGSGSRPCSVSVGYVNNDTHLDIVVANYATNSISVHLGDGNGSFASPIFTSLDSSRPFSLAVGYLNNDHVLDIAVANYGTATIAVLLGNNDGSFQIDNSYDMGYDSNPYALILADFNREDKADIVAVNYGTGELAILFNDGNGSFVMEKYWTGFDSQPSSVTAGDFNNDNMLDIAVAYSGSSSIGIFIDNGNRSFTNTMIYSMDVGSRPQFINAGDFNNDTYMDIAVIDSQSGQVVIFKGDGNGRFSIVTRHSTGYNSVPSSIIVGDFDNDHKLDLAISNSGTNNILILTSYISNPVANPTTYTTGNNSFSNSLSLGDFNHDKYLDIAISNSNSGSVGVLLNLGNGTFTSQQIYDMGENSYPVFVLTDDVNNDYHLDILVSLGGIGSIGILLGCGNGSFIHASTLSTGNNSYSTMLAVGDLDNDDNLDIIGVNAGVGNIGLFFGFGDGNFTDVILLSIKIDFYPKFAAVGDINNDTILDIVVSNNATAGGLAIFLGYGNRSFHDAMFISTGKDIVTFFRIGDVNNDQRLDIIYTSFLSSYIAVWLGNGNGTFGTITKYLGTRRTLLSSVALGYYNDDAFVDLAVSSFFDFSINIFLGTANGSFGTPNGLPTGSNTYPSFVLFGDFNNDHQQDLAVANSGTHNVEVLLIYYEADFTKEVNYTTGSGSHPVSVSIGDFNNDGEFDVVVANSGNDDINVFVHDNNRIFINKTILSTGPNSHPQSVTVGDFNRDHFLDIAAVNLWTNSMNVFLGLGKGTFDRRTEYSIGSGSTPKSIVAGDLNNDGRMDVVIANQDADNVAVFLAFDYVLFTSDTVDVPGVIPVPCYVGTGDFNNDNLLDMAVTDFTDNILIIYLGHGNGTFSDEKIYLTGPLSSPCALTIGDFNNDNYLDIVVTNLGTNNIVVFLGYGDGSFQSQTRYSTGDSSKPTAAAIADLNNDNRLDIVVANYNSNNILVFWGYGNGSFTDGQVVYSMVNQSNPTWVAVNDLNNDGIPDIAVANNIANNVCIIFGYGNGSFGNVTMLSTGKGSTPISIGLGDLNGDKSIDIAVSNQGSRSVGLFFGFGNGSFSSIKSYSVDSNAVLEFIIVSDINNDTFLDILVANSKLTSSSVKIFYGFGDGNFTLPTIYPTAVNSQPYSIATGDFNNDKKVDFVVSYLNQDSIGLFIQMKSQPFASSALLPTGNQSHPQSAAVGDFNNDDCLDIVVANSFGHNIGIFLGYGNGDFADQLTYSTGKGSLPSSIGIGHFNDDHYLDIAVVNTVSDNIGILLGNGNGRFTSMTIYSTGATSIPVSIAVNDMNKDDHLDLVVANWGASDVLVFLGKGNGLFFEPKEFSVGYGAHPQSVAIGDINKDGRLDIVVANYGTDYVEVLLQTC